MKHHVFASVLGMAMALAFSQAGMAQERGTATNLPLPRFVSMKAQECNARRGPSLTHRIDWVFKQRDMPLEITAEFGHWRRVRDRDGAGGWVHYSLLSGSRTVIVTEKTIDVFSRPDPSSMVEARFEEGVIARIVKCSQDWCSIAASGYDGWALKSGLWGVGPDELID